MATILTEAGRKARAAYLREYRRRKKVQLQDVMINHWNKVGMQMEAEEAKKKGEEYIHVPTLIKISTRFDTITKLTISLQVQGLPDEAIEHAIFQTARERCEDYGLGFGDSDVRKIITDVLRHVKKGDLLETVGKIQKSRNRE